MVDSLNCLWHHIVVGSDDYNHKVGDFCTAGTHGREGFVTGGVEESDVTSVGELDVVGADVLCNAAGFACDYICLADVVEQRCLAVVDVTHYGDNGRTAYEVFLAVFFLVDSVGYFGRNILGGEAEFIGHDIDSFGIETLVDRHHDAEVHASGDNVVDRHIHHCGEVVSCNELGDFEYAAFGLFGLMSLTLATCGGLTFFFAPFGTFFQTLVFGCETCERLFNLLLYVFFVYVGSNCRTLRLLIATVVALIVAAVFALVVATALITVFAVLIAVSALLRTVVAVAGSAPYFFDIDFFFAAYATAFLAVGIVSCSSALRAV